MPPENQKSVKKEQQDSEDDEKPISQVRNKNKKKPLTPTSGATKQQSKIKKEELNDSVSPLKKSKQAKPKKEEPDFCDDKKPNIKDDKKKAKKVQEEEKGKGDGKKREKKVYDLPGQKRDPPEEREPLRIFYESLYEQKPGSELAEVWMMENGLLPFEEAKRVYERKMNIKNRKLTSPLKPVKTVKETAKSVTVKKKVEPSTPNPSTKKKVTETTTVTKQSKKRKAESSEEDPSSDEDSGDEFIVSAKKVLKKVRAN